MRRHHRLFEHLVPAFVLTLALGIGAISVECAHLTAVAEQCEPTKAQVVAGVLAFTPDSWESLVAAFVRTEGLCVARAVAADLANSTRSAGPHDDGGAASFALLAAPTVDVPAVAHARDWLASH